ncbi:putative Cystatin domain-containing protein [Rosa chinensis]|uniref:Putative Cystatin domain-containing protein n=2 Tax=Rosa chinensis TaxID=74649 RepID=A0A2P6Q4L7_ROSCH|nr:putative Cystatin domain-containing protein [Rosa chinensis]
MMRPICLLLSLFLFGFLLAVGAVSFDASFGPVVGAPWPVNINDPEVKEIAEFAVSEFNKESGKTLVFQKVVSGLGQDVAGVTYDLVIAVRDESLPSSPIVNYACYVWERSWENFRKLESFHQVLPSS